MLHVYLMANLCIYLAAHLIVGYCVTAARCSADSHRTVAHYLSLSALSPASPPPHGIYTYGSPCAILEKRGEARKMRNRSEKTGAERRRWAVWLFSLQNKSRAVSPQRHRQAIVLKWSITSELIPSMWKVESLGFSVASHMTCWVSETLS